MELIENFDYSVSSPRWFLSRRPEKPHTQNGGCDSTTRILTLCFTNFRARKVYEDANQRLREDAIKANDEAQGKEFRVMLLENWRDFELENQDEESIKKVSNLMPKRVKKRRRIEQDEDAPGSLYFN